MSRGPSVLFEFLHVTNRHVVAKEHKKITRMAFKSVRGEFFDN